jgi:hypothetical protein
MTPHLLNNKSKMDWRCASSSRGEKGEGKGKRGEGRRREGERERENVFLKFQQNENHL